MRTIDDHEKSHGDTMAPRPVTTLPPVSVLIATYNRPEDVARCLPTILANDYPDFEVVLGDQSPGPATVDVVAAIGDPRVRVLRLAVRGKSRAVNHALPHLMGAVVAMIDDDVTVPPDWLGRAVAALLREPQPIIICGAVVPVPHDRRREVVAEHVPASVYRVRGPPLFPGRLVPAFEWAGIGAHFILWRADLERLGGFDEWLGVGSPLEAEDLDLCYRALRAGLTLVHLPEPAVVHWGKRSGPAAQVLSARYGFGLGAVYMRNLRRGDWLAAAMFLQDLLWRLRKIAGALKRREQPPELRFTIYMVIGALAALRYPTSLKRPPTST
jgi:GT2 family glycosyltransferase